MSYAFNLAEVHGNRTHRGPLKPATGFEVQEAHQNLSTSVFRLIDFPFKVKAFRGIQEVYPILNT